MESAELEISDIAHKRGRINIFWSYYNHHDHHRETVFQCEGVQRLLK